MATKGDITDLAVLEYNGAPLVPLVSGFTRTRHSGVVRSKAAGGSMRQRKKYYNMPHVADVSFYLGDPALQDFIQLFIGQNEGKKFICYLAADRPVVEPYVVQAIDEWHHSDVNAITGIVHCQFEIFSVRDVCLDEFLASIYPCVGENLYCLLTGMDEIVKEMPIV
jgi:hypothetical protein